MSIFILLSGKTHLFSGNLGLCCICVWSFFHQVRNSLAFWHIVDRVMAFVKALFDLFIKAKGHIILLLEWPFVAFNKVIYDLQLLSTKPKIKVFVITLSPRKFAIPNSRNSQIRGFESCSFPLNSRFF